MRINQEKRVSVNLRKIAVAGIAVATVCGMSACSSKDKEQSTNTPSNASKTSTSATQTSASPAKPTPEELQKILNKAVDHAVPTSQKVNTVQEGQKAPELFDKVAKLKEENGATFQVVAPIVPMGKNRIQASLKVKTKTEEVADQQITFVFDNGEWKVAKTWICNTIGMMLPDEIPAACTV